MFQQFYCALFDNYAQLSRDSDEHFVRIIGSIVGKVLSQLIVDVIRSKVPAQLIVVLAS